MEQLRKELEARYTFEDIVGRSPAMRRVFEILPDIAASNSTVLIEGASGTGKELFARAIHDLSPRKKKRFVAVNCAALPDTLLESELFGYKAGAFTDARRDKPGRFALADGGTIFLDEIGDISPAMQVRLLRVLQERTIEPLGATETAGQFRKLDAVAVLTGPLPPAPRVHPHARRRGQVLVLSSRVHQIGAAADLDELDAQLGELCFGASYRLVPKRRVSGRDLARRKRFSCDDVVRDLRRASRNAVLCRVHCRCIECYRRQTGGYRSEPCFAATQRMAGKQTICTVVSHDTKRYRHGGLVLRRGNACCISYVCAPV